MILLSSVATADPKAIFFYFWQRTSGQQWKITTIPVVLQLKSVFYRNGSQSMSNNLLSAKKPPRKFELFIPGTKLRRCWCFSDGRNVFMLVFFTSNSLMLFVLKDCRHYLLIPWKVLRQHFLSCSAAVKIGMSIEMFALSSKTNSPGFSVGFSKKRLEKLTLLPHISECFFCGKIECVYTLHPRHFPKALNIFSRF